MTASADAVEVRIATPQDADLAPAAAAMILDASTDADIAPREEEFLRGKIETGRAAVALADGELVGFGYYSEWEGGRFVSHSGLVVRRDHQGIGLGRKLKEQLFHASRERFPDATTMSLTTSKAVEQLNLSFGFHHAPLDELTTDPAFWAGCLPCKRYPEAQAAGKKCCCFGMILPPEDAPTA